MKTRDLTFAIAIAGAMPALWAVPYEKTASAIDAGGRRSSSVSYSHAGSVGGIVGISTAAAPAETAKHGYMGQLVEVTGLQLSASPATVNETATRQLTAVQVLDDATTLAVNPNSIAWSVVTGPIGSISSTGLATASTVYQNTGATVQGSFAGHTGQLGLTVANVTSDDYQAYAADGIDDDWQVFHFGMPPNANAGPGADPDHDGQHNLFEFVAGVLPNDAASRFLLRIEPVTGQPLQKKLIFSPRLTDRTYTVESNTNLGVSWPTLPGTSFSDNGTERTVIDPNASEPKKFYRVNITKP